MRKITLIITLIMCLMLSSTCLANKPWYVMTSLFPIQEFARAVGGDLVTVDLILPPGAEPHAWEPKPSDIINLAKADLFIYLEAGMEPWVHDLLKGVNRPSLRVLEISQELQVEDGLGGDNLSGDSLGMDENPRHDHQDEPSQPLNNHKHVHEQIHEQVYKHPEQVHKQVHKHPAGQRDPHLWLDFSYDQLIIDRIAKALSELDPANAEFYSANASQYQKKLAKLDQRYQEGLAKCRCRKIFLGGHSAFAYLAKRYDLEQITLYGISPDAEPSPKRLAEITDLAKKYQVKAIYFEELVSDRMARVLAEEIGAMVLVLNPGANVTKERLKSGVTFLSLMEENLKNLQKGLDCE